MFTLFYKCDPCDLPFDIVNPKSIRDECFVINSYHQNERKTFLKGHLCDLDL